MIRFLTVTLLVLPFATMTVVTADEPAATKPDAPAERLPASKFTAAGHTTDTLATVKERLKKKQVILVDVREKKEWDAGHLGHAKLVPLSAVKSGKLTREMLKSLPKDKPIYVHCAAGGRVLKVSEILRPQGFDIRPLKDGYDKLLKAGFEKAKPKK